MKTIGNTNLDLLAIAHKEAKQLKRQIMFENLGWNLDEYREVDELALAHEEAKRLKREITFEELGWFVDEDEADLNIVIEEDYYDDSAAWAVIDEIIKLEISEAPRVDYLAIAHKTAKKIRRNAMLENLGWDIKDNCNVDRLAQAHKDAKKQRRIAMFEKLNWPIYNV